MVILGFPNHLILFSEVFFKYPPSLNIFLLIICLVIGSFASVQIKKPSGGVTLKMGFFSCPLFICFGLSSPPVLLPLLFQRQII